MRKQSTSKVSSPKRLLIFVAKSPAAEKPRSGSTLVGSVLIKRLYALCKKSLSVPPFSNNSISFWIFTYSVSHQIGMLGRCAFFITSLSLPVILLLFSRPKEIDSGGELEESETISRVPHLKQKVQLQIQTHKLLMIQLDLKHLGFRVTQLLICGILLKTELLLALFQIRTERWFNYCADVVSIFKFF